jgi:4-amino-4-deoxy-L-arabinose transferase-like glycosyltransferase
MLVIDEKQIIKQERIIMLLLFTIAMIVRLWFLPTYRVISADGIGYISVARDLMRGSASFWSANHPPIYPALIAFTGLFVADLELAGRLVSIFMGSLLVVPLYLLGRDLFSRETGILAALLAVVWAPLRGWSCEVMSQATYLTLLLLGLYLFLLMIRMKAPLLGFLSGIFMGLAYLTRPEVLMVYAAMFLFGIVRLCLEAKERNRQAFVALLSGLVGFLVLLIPYLFILKAITGSWQLTGKSGAALADALSRYLGHPDLKRELGFHSFGYLDVIRMYPDFIFQNAGYNLAKTWDIFAPKWLWMLALFGFVFAGKSRDSVWERILLCTLFAPLLILSNYSAPCFIINAGHVP